MTARTRSIVLFMLTGLAVLLTAGGVILWVGYRVSQITRDAYAVWWTADLVIEHMEKHSGSWPRSWDELRATSEQAYKATGSTNPDGAMVAEFRPRDSIEELRERVEIDWNADPKELAKAAFRETGPPFRVIWLRNGKSTHYSGREPNEMILEYLKRRDTATTEASQ